MELINPSPVVHKVTRRRVDAAVLLETLDEDQREPIDAEEIFEHVRDISDPEHPYSLEQLNVVDVDSITVDDHLGMVRVQFTPTVEHCSMATLIGLCIRVKLLQSLPSRFKVDIALTPGSHATENAVNKQLNDKERVAAALENPGLLNMVNKCLHGVAMS
jgi:metal-sulfur cluster biosynthetic enzyme